MKISDYKFGSIKIDGKIYNSDVIIDQGKILLRDQSPSEKHKEDRWHTPLTTLEYIPWNCQVLYIATGESGTMEVLPAVKEEAQKRGVKLVIDDTSKIAEQLKNGLAKNSNAILHLTC